MQREPENIEQAHDARVVDFEAGMADGPDGDRAGQVLQQKKVDMTVEPFGLVTGEAIGDVAEGGAYGVEIVEPLLEAEVIEIV